MSDKSEDILCVLRKNKSITKQTIDSLIKNGFNSNETLSALDLDLDLPQMTDICCQQKRCLRQVFEKHNFGFNCYSILYKYREIDFEDNQQLSEESDEEINTSEEGLKERQLKSNESISSNIELEEKSVEKEREREERLNRSKVLRDLYSGNNHRFEIFLQKSLNYDLTDYEDSEESPDEDSDFEDKNKSLKSETFKMKSEFDSQFNYNSEKSDKSREKVKKSEDFQSLDKKSENKRKIRRKRKVTYNSIKREINSKEDEIKKYIKRDNNEVVCLYADCGKRFRRLDQMKGHIQRHLGIKPFKCEYEGCDYECVERCTFNRHTIGVHQSKVHLKCNKCDTSFKNRFDLRTHKLRVHQKRSSDENEIQKYIKPEKNGFSCLYTDCGKQFQYIYHMKHHIRRHLGLNPFICQYKGCDYKSVDSYNFKRHISSVHRSKGDLKCNEC